MFEDIINYLAPNFDSAITGASLYVVLSILGAVVGFVSGLFGVGGGFLLVPIMNILLGIPITLAVGSGACYMIGTSSSGLIKQIRNKNVDFHALLFIAIGSAIGAVLGDIIQTMIINNERMLQIIFFIVLLIIAGVMYFSPKRDFSKKLLLQRFSLGPRVNLIHGGIDDISILGLILLGIFGGLLIGLLGVSGGVLFTPFLMIGVGLSAHIATGTSLGIIVVSSISAVIKKGLSGSGKISLPIALSLLIAGAIGVQFGVALGQKIHSEKLKRYFSFVALLAAVMVLVKILG